MTRRVRGTPPVTSSRSGHATVTRRPACACACACVCVCVCLRVRACASLHCYVTCVGCNSGREQPAPPPPPPPPPPPAPAAPPAHSGTMKSNRSVTSVDGLHEELKMVLPQIQKRRNMLDIKKTPDIFIDQKSNPDEVTEWLDAKGFSTTAQRALRVPGYQLFALTRGQLEKALGADEGKRLYSQILVQRNISGYKTTSASELQSILRKVREKVEVS